jgi:hypothetical protein
MTELAVNGLVFDRNSTKFKYGPKRYCYMNYHPTNDYPINLENVYKMIGFANKENAKRTLRNNFTMDEDYKKLLVRTDELVRKDEQKHTDETRCGSKTAPEVAGAVFPTKTIK